MMRMSQARTSNQNLVNPTTNENAPWNLAGQLQGQLCTAPLGQLHADIKARAELPDPTYEKLPRFRHPPPFDVRILLDYVQHLIHYFELF
jgi:hypothetical protein